MRVTLELGLKRKRVVAAAAGWPGLVHGATTEEAALERVRAYVPRYAQVAKLAGMEAAFATITGLEVVERYPGTGSTDFWGISFGFSSIDQQAMSSEALERELTLMRACLAFFDEVRSQVLGLVRLLADAPPPGLYKLDAHLRPEDLATLWAVIDASCCPLEL